MVESETASVTCRAHGKPPPTFKWIKSSTQQDLTTADRFSVDRLTGVLTIRDVSKDDNGGGISVLLQMLQEKLSTL